MQAVCSCSRTTTGSSRAFARAECTVVPERLDDAHYRGAARFTTDLDVESDWSGSWKLYLQDYIRECGVAEIDRAEAHRARRQRVRRRRALAPRHSRAVVKGSRPLSTLTFASV